MMIAILTRDKKLYFKQFLFILEVKIYQIKIIYEIYLEEIP